jgi:hypothetical protein
MTTHSFHYVLFMSLFGAAPLLLGANGKGCSDVPISPDGGESDGGGAGDKPGDAAAPEDARSPETGAETADDTGASRADAAGAETADDAGASRADAEATEDASYADASDTDANAVNPDAGSETLAEAAVPSGVPCTTATDCHGALPQICVAASPANPVGGCAHWACVDGHCEIQIGQ